jgi:hypothetical protein
VTAVRATTISGPPTLPESLRDDWQRLTAPTTAATLFTQDLLDGLPEPARRWLRHAVAPGTPLRRAAVLRQHGEIKVGRWLRYEADWALAPPAGFIWAATSHFGPLFIRGFEPVHPRNRTAAMAHFRPHPVSVRRWAGCQSQRDGPTRGRAVLRSCGRVVACGALGAAR